MTDGKPTGPQHHAMDPTGRSRVLLVIDELDIGGTEQQILELVRRLPAAQYAPLVCCFRYGRKAAEIERLGVPVLHLRKHGRFDAGLVRRLAQLMRRERVEIAHTFLIGGNLWGRIAAVIARVPAIIASERNVDVWEEPVKRVIGRTLARFTHRVVANADAVRDYLIARGLDRTRVVTIRNGVDLTRFETPLDVGALRRSLDIAPEHRLAIVVARVEPQKGQDTVVEAAALLRERHPQLRFVFVGGGSQAENLRALVARRGLADRVRLVGFRTDASDLIRAADLSVLVSTREGLSNTLLESLAAARPVVASRVGGNAEVVRPDAGFLVPPRDPVALAEAVGRLVGDPVSAARMGARGREWVRREFSVGRMVAETVALYQTLGGVPPLTAPARLDVAS